jgi:hypothetical protein
LWVCLVGFTSCFGPHKILFGWLHCFLDCTVVVGLGSKLGQPGRCAACTTRDRLICVPHYAGRAGPFVQPERATKHSNLHYASLGRPLYSLPITTHAFPCPLRLISSWSYYGGSDQIVSSDPFRSKGKERAWTERGVCPCETGWRPIGCLLVVLPFRSFNHRATSDPFGLCHHFIFYHIFDC